jgi:hypothetical protein
MREKGKRRGRVCAGKDVSLYMRREASTIRGIVMDAAFCSTKRTNDATDPVYEFTFLSVYIYLIFLSLD